VRLRLGFLSHGFLVIKGELVCSGKRVIPPEVVAIETATGEVMGSYLGAEYQINLCEGCYEAIILCMAQQLAQAVRA